MDIKTFFVAFSIFAATSYGENSILNPDTAIRLGGEEDIVKIVDSDVKFGEGPVWRKAQSEILFSDIPRNAIYRWTEKDGKTLFMRPAGFLGKHSEIPKNLALGPNGLAITSEGALAICQQGNRRIASLDEKNFSVNVIVDSYNGKLFNNPNDLVFVKDGSVFFTDPSFWRRHREPSSNEVDFNGIYKTSSDGTTILIDTLPQPNGIGFSPDEKYMYISQSGVGNHDPCWYVYELDDSKSTVKSKRVFCNLKDWKGRKLKGTPDGLTVSKDGTIFASGTGGVHIFDSTLKHLGFIETSVQVTNCCVIEDANSDKLFATGAGKVYVIDIKTALERAKKAIAQKK